MIDRWTIVGVFMVAGVGALAYLRVVSNELAMRLRALTLRLDADRRDRQSASTTSADPSQVYDAAAVNDPEHPSTERAA